MLILCMASITVLHILRFLFTGLGTTIFPVLIDVACTLRVHAVAGVAGFFSAIQYVNSVRRTMCMAACHVDRSPFDLCMVSC